MKLTYILSEPALAAYTGSPVEENWKKWLGATALAGSLVLGHSLVQPDKQPVNDHPAWQYYKKQRTHEKKQRADKEEQLHKAGRTRGTFVQGKLVSEPGTGRPTDRDKSIISSTSTSPDAEDYLK